MYSCRLAKGDPRPHRQDLGSEGSVAKLLAAERGSRHCYAIRCSERGAANHALQHVLGGEGPGSTQLFPFR